MSDNIELDDPLAYMRERANQKLNQDPLAEGIVHGGRHITDVSRALNTLLFKDKCKQVLLEVRLSEDNHHVSFEIKRKK